MTLVNRGLRLAEDIPKRGSKAAIDIVHPGYGCMCCKGSGRNSCDDALLIPLFGLFNACIVIYAHVYVIYYVC